MAYENLALSNSALLVFEGSPPLFSDLHMDLQTTFLHQDSHVKRAVRVMVHYVALRNNVSVCTVKPEDILTKDAERAIYAYSRELTWSLKFISSARRVARLLGNEELFPATKMKVESHPTVTTWLNGSGIPATSAEDINYSCARFFRWMQSQPEFRRFAVQQIPISLLQRRHLIQYRSSLLRQVATHRLTGASAKQYLQNIVRFVRAMQERGQLRGIDTFRITIRGSKSRERTIPNEYEIRNLFAAIGSRSDWSIYRLFFILLLNTGARPGELIKLTRSHLDLNDKAIWLQSKGGSGRWLPLSEDVWTFLIDYVSSLKDPSPDLPIFRTAAGTKMNYRHVKTVLRTAREKYGVYIDGCVSFRHKFATDCLESNLGWKTTCDLLGWRNPSQLMRYQHVRASHLVDVVMTAFVNGIEERG